MITIKATYGVLRVSEPHEPVSGDYYRENDPKWIAFRKKYHLKQGTDPIYKWYMLFLELLNYNNYGLQRFNDWGLDSS